MTRANKIYLAFLLLLFGLIGLEIKARADYNVTEGSGKVIFAFTCFTSKVCPAHVNIDNAGTEIFTASNPGYARVASGHIASGAIASGAIASGAVASGAFSSGSIASGALAAGSMVDLLTIRGTKAAGTAAANSALTGGVYNSGGVTLTDGQQAATQFHSDGSTLVRVTGSVGVAQGSTTSGQTGSLVMGAVTSAAPSYTTAQTSPISLDTLGNTRVASGGGDPCQAKLATVLPFSITSATTTNILTGTASQKIYVCYLYMQTAIANNIAVIEGTTGGTCGSGTAAMIGGTTAANGLNNAANSGQALGNGGFTVLQTQTNNNDICIITSAAGPLAGVIKYVKQ